MGERHVWRRLQSEEQLGCLVERVLQGHELLGDEVIGERLGARCQAVEPCERPPERGRERLDPHGVALLKRWDFHAEDRNGVSSVSTGPSATLVRW